MKYLKIKKFLLLNIFFILSNISFFAFCNIPQNSEYIIDQALKLELPTSSNITSIEANNFSDQAYKKVYEANYVEAIKITIEGLKKFPENFVLQSDLAALLGDCSEIIPSPLKDKMIQKSKELFYRLDKEVDNQPKEVFFDFKNEYYYRYAKYKEQYEFGLSRVSHYWKTDEWTSQGIRGYYSQGVGAANYARTLIKEGNKQLAHDYAYKAIIAFAQYFSYKNNYYNSYVHYAMALGILGYKEEMMHALTKSALLINHDLSYFEFKEVIDFVETNIDITERKETMLNKEIIKLVIEKRDIIPFPEQFKQLRDQAQIDYYEVDLKNKSNTYVGQNEKFIENFENQSFNISNNFDEKMIKTALDQRRNKKTTFFEFLKEIALAGVTKYRVDMKKNMVTYYGNSQEYNENIPPHLIQKS